jgi:hypothetical protein
MNKDNGISAKAAGLSSGDGAASVSTLRASIPDVVTCVFCGFTQAVEPNGQHIFVAQDDVAICEHCVEHCRDLVREQRADNYYRDFLAQGIEAGTGETERLDAKRESPVTAGDAP